MGKPRRCPARRRPAERAEPPDLGRMTRPDMGPILPPGGPRPPRLWSSVSTRRATLKRWERGKAAAGCGVIRGARHGKRLLHARPPGHHGRHRSLSVGHAGQVRLRGSDSNLIPSGPQALAKNGGGDSGDDPSSPCGSTGGTGNGSGVSKIESSSAGIEVTYADGASEEIENSHHQAKTRRAGRSRSALPPRPTSTVCSPCAEPAVPRETAVRAA